MTENKLLKGFHLDVRTKLVLMITLSIVSFRTSNKGAGLILTIFTAVLPFVLLLCYGSVKMALEYGVLYSVMYVVSQYLFVYITGGFGMIILGICAVFNRMLPWFVVGYIFVYTTKVDEFRTAMDRMHIPMKLSIPISVLFRFFPTLGEEYRSIASAMKMRGIRFGGKHPTKIIEYRMIPFLMSGVRIGEELSAAALTRGLGAPVKKTSILHIGFGVYDVILMLLCCTMWIIFIALHF